MKKSLEEHAARFSEIADEYDDDNSPEYRACADLVVEHAAPEADDTVLDLGCGTGAIALALASDESDSGAPNGQSGTAPAGRVIGRDISEGMLEQAESKAEERGLGNVEFGEGRFRDPNAPADADVDVVTTNFAMHHLSDDEKREGIAAIADLEPRRVVIGDVMFFGEPNPDVPFYSPEVDDPATVGVLADALTDSGFALTAVEMVHDQVGVLAAERVPGVAADTDGVPSIDEPDRGA
ncbi:class I SAM-dependent methyltransferase [Halostella pelagica]|uniref:class I SAM-dependent methyltransferase n=1 Tax=Halostella pelagica TaxID=2583824 RepID=UPI00108113F6|nr:class I SAM-dependent methyltransferase [Halostella pelagica]